MEINQNYHNFNNMNKTDFLAIILGALGMTSCNSPQSKSMADVFPNNLVTLVESPYNLDMNALAHIEGLMINDSSLIVCDYHSGESYTLFDLKTGSMLGRYGTVGQGPKEIPLGCAGSLEGNSFYAFDDQVKIIVKYDIDSLRQNIHSPLVRLSKYDIKDAQLSKIVPINDSLFVGAGVYQEKYQYLLFNKASKVLNYAVEIYNSQESGFNIYHKYLSNQGNLEKRPGKNQFVYSINLSSNLDFFEVRGNDISLTKSLRFGNPEYQPAQNGSLNRVIPTENSIMGYLDISATDEYVYALYSDKKWKDSRYNSDMVLTFDWQGKMIRMYKLPQPAYYIAVDENSHRMYAAVMRESGEWDIASYDISD